MGNRQLLINYQLPITYYRTDAIIVISPCCPKRISRSRLNIPTQIIGVMSTPPNGGTIFLVIAKNGSVGQPIRLKGKRLRLTWGYQVSTIRKMKRRVISPNRIPRVQLVMVAVVMVV